MTAVRWLAAALADVQHITRHISEENPRAAAKVARELTAVWPYIIVYEVNSQAEEVSVLRVWHGAQDR